MTSKFVLIHSDKGIEEAKARLAAPQPPATGRLASAVGHFGGAVLDGIDFLRDAGGLSNLLRSKTATSATTLPPPRPTRKVRRKTTSAPRPARVTVGIWSLDAWLGSLPGLIEAFNGKQSTFVFFEVEATVPSGLISRPERMIAWLTEAAGKKPDPATARTIKDNLIANDFFGLANSVRTDFGLDYIIGVTPSMVAGKDDEGYYTNHFSTSDDRTLLVSSYQLRDFAASSGISFDAFLATIIVAQLLVTISPELDFHDDRRCLFDYNNDRVSLVNDVRDPGIEPACRQLIEPQYREAADALVDVIRSIRSTKS